jgi:hypothetical protein
MLPVEAGGCYDGGGIEGGVEGGIDGSRGPDAAPSRGWTPLTPVAPAAGAWPAARENTALAYDQARDRVVLFAGSHTLRDLWEWDPKVEAWTERTPATVSAPWPAPHYGHAMVYDGSRGKALVYGGGTTVGVLAETWEWDGQAGTWEKRVTSGSPPALTSHAMAYDSSRKKVFLFGGWDNDAAAVSDRLWEWDGVAGTWTDRTPAPRPAAWPPAREATAMVYNSVQDKLQLFGGFDGHGGNLRDLWARDQATGTWTDLTQAFGPTARSSHAAAYSPSRQQMIIFGGAPCVGSSLWTWYGAGGWADLSDYPTGRARPGAMTGHAMAHDALRATTYLFGGAELWSWWDG